MTKSVLGIIGGSGIYDLPGLENVREQRIPSPWGKPSAALRIGDIAGLPVVFLSRHDKGHRLSPSDINYRANIDVLKRAGVTDLVSLSACGSFKEELPPGAFVLVDQFFDRTYKRESSFFGTGCVAHVSMAHPTSPRLRAHLAEAAIAEDIPLAREGTYVCIEGPQFSTYAESITYKKLGFSVIGMTNMPEAKLAREAEICYATVAMVTDFDCWHPDHDAVTVQDIIRMVNANADKAKRLVARLVRDFPRETVRETTRDVMREQSRGSEDRLPRHSIESLDSLSVDIARMIDHDAAADLWDRYKRGERNVFTRRLYTLQGQQAFDDIRKKYRADREFKQTVDRYISEFERLLEEVSRDDRGQVVARTYLTSETGKVYTMLAHAAGRFD